MTDNEYDKKSENNEDTDAVGKSIQEISDSLVKNLQEISEIINQVNKTGKFLGRVMGEPIEDAVGLVADRIKFYRLLNYIKLVENTNEILREKNIDQDEFVKKLPFKIALPLIENATLEEDSDMQKLWAKMLANALDPNFQIDVDKKFISILSEMDPLDVLILKVCCRQNIDFKDALFEKSKIAEHLKRDLNVKRDFNDVEVSIINLIRLGCAKPGSQETDGFLVNGKVNTIYLGTESFHISELGLRIYKSAIS